VCMYVCMCVCMYVCVYVCMCVARQDLEVATITLGMHLYCVLNPHPVY
jgi:hypothetical protein